LLSPLPNNPDPDDSQSDWPPLSSAVCGDRQETPFPPHLLHSDSIHISISWVGGWLPPGQARPCHFSILSLFFFIPSWQVNWKWPSRKRRARDSLGKKEEAGELTSSKQSGIYFLAQTFVKSWTFSFAFQFNQPTWASFPHPECYTLRQLEYVRA
jgi:hypothetical protein